jgi:uncharacterized protein YecT (DUF1311 family)
LAAFALIVALLAVAPAAEAHPDCEALYDGDGVTRNYKRAFACYQAEENWLMVTVMQLNGDGTPADVAGARKSLEADERGRGAETGDQMNLDAILKKREADPKAKGPRIDFCDDVAATTPNLNWCQSRELEHEKREKEARLRQMRSRLDKSVWPAFDKLTTAFEPFAKADATRVYQEYVDGTIRNAYSMSQEKFDRENFEALVKLLSGEVAAVPKAPRAFAAADAELNAVYRDLVRSTAGGWQQDAATDADKDTAATHRQYAEDYGRAARAAQRAWIRYRDLAGKLAAARWPQAAGIEDVVRSLVTDDRIRELRNSEGP